MKILTSPTHMGTFSEMKLPAALMNALGKMAIAKPTAIQGQAIPVGLTGSDMIAVAQTGSGKTLAYALSLLTTLANKPEARALILAPSREMAQQIHKVFIELCTELPISSVLVIGGTPNGKQVSALKKNPRLIVATPGRMNDHLITNKLLLQGVEVVVIDEADRMLDMGFAPQLASIKRTMRGTWQTLMFSASFSESIQQIAELFMRHEVYMIRSAKAEAPVATLKQKILLLDRSMKKDRLLDELNATKGAGVIVFTGSKESCEDVGNYLQEYGFKTDFIHGDLSAGHRNRIMREFRAGDIRVLVATDLLARGLDVPHVDYVMNFDLPYSYEDFLHRIGRTARAGRGGHAITFVTPSDHRSYKKIREYIKDAEEIKVDPKFAFIDRSLKFAKAKQSDTKNKRSGKPGRRTDFKR